MNATIQTIDEYRENNQLTWLEVAQRFYCDYPGQAANWAKSGFLIVTSVEQGKSIERLVSTRRERKEA